MKNALIGIGGVAVLMALLWLALFGTTPPCDAMRSEMRVQLARERPEFVTSALDSLGYVSTFQCAAFAVRLKCGDSSVVTVVPVSEPPRGKKK